jgi:hypothetical protein
MQLPEAASRALTTNNARNATLLHPIPIDFALSTALQRCRDGRATICFAGIRLQRTHGSWYVLHAAEHSEESLALLLLSVCNDGG